MKQKLHDTILNVVKSNRYLTNLNNIRLQHKFDAIKIPQEEIIIAENSSTQKETFLENYIRRWPQRVNGIDAQVNSMSKQREISKTDRDEIIFCYLAYGFTPTEFFAYHLGDKKNYEERRSFLADRDVMEIVYKYNDSSSIEIFNDKSRTYEKYSQFFGREAITIQSEADYELFRQFIRGKEDIVRKSVRESTGRGVALVKLKEYSGKEEELFGELLKGGKMLIEERIQQDERMAALNPSSVNTIRLITFNTQNGIVATYCFLKAGRESSFVDNGGAGGILIGVDIESGVTTTNGIAETGERFDIHPDTHVELKGFQLPAFRDAICMAKELAKMAPKVKYIGWDLAYTKDGWIVVEGNGMGQLIGPQSAMQRGIRSEVESILKNMTPIV